MVASNAKVLSLTSEQLYRERERRFNASAAREDRRSLALSRVRLATFAAGAIALVAALGSTGGTRSALLVVAAVAAIGFALLVSSHNRVDDRLQRLSTLAAINRRQAARVRREWGAAPPVEVPTPPDSHPYALDLDIVGPRASVLNLCGAVATPAGRRTLQAWLLSSATAAEIRERQQAVAELATLLDFRQELETRATLAGQGRATHDEDLAHFLDWSEGRTWLLRRPWLVWLTRLLGAATVGLAIADATGAVEEPLWLAPMLLNIVLWFLLVRAIEHRFNRAFARNSAPGQEARMFHVVCRENFTSAPLVALRERTSGADLAMRRLQRLMELADARLNALLHFPLNALTLWDFHVLAALERWQVRFGVRVRDWFEAVGQVEAMSAFAGLRHDNPSWALPEFGDDPVLEATDLGHPLIAESVRVANDVTLGPPGTFLFVTGSNMSGKSTLLRAIGVNVVLAQAGGPVCAASMTLPRVALHTSMRVQDSLEEGVSYFMAALRRLKGILEEARRTRPDGEVALLYLLDEVLQGTNTAERQIAVRTILDRLLQSAAIGAVTSHDLNLADEEPLRHAAVAVHFTEHFEPGPAGTVMRFDYRLLPGVATSRNALKLMKMIGIEEPS